MKEGSVLNVVVKLLKLSRAQTSAVCRTREEEKSEVEVEVDYCLWQKWGLGAPAFFTASQLSEFFSFARKSSTIAKFHK